VTKPHKIIQLCTSFGRTDGKLLPDFCPEWQKNKGNKWLQKCVAQVDF